MRKGILRSTAIGAAVGAGAFLALGIYLNATTGMGPLTNFGPLAILAVVGATIGGLVAPLVSSRGRRDRG